MLFIVIIRFHITKLSKGSCVCDVFTFIPKISSYFKLWEFFFIYNKQAGHHTACIKLPVLPCCETISAKLTPAVTHDAEEECPFENNLCYLISSSSVEFISGAESQMRWEEVLGDGAAVICVERDLPVCLFLRWLIQGAELGVGPLPLGRKRAAPFTVRKLSLILEEKKEKRHEVKPQTQALMSSYLIILGLLCSVGIKNM